MKFYTKNAPNAKAEMKRSLLFITAALFFAPLAHAEDGGFFQRLRPDVFLNTFWGNSVQNTPTSRPLTTEEQKQRERISLDQDGYPFKPEIFIGAVRRGDLPIIQRFIYAGMDPNAIILGMPSLLHAAQSGKLDTVELLLKNGADINSLNGRRENALVLALKSKNTRLAADLVNRGINLKQQDIDRWTALHHAVYQDNGDIMVKIIRKDPSLLNVATNAGFTPLMTAIWQGNQPMVDVLVGLGAKTDVLDTGGNTPLHLAVSRNQYDIAKGLLDSGANPNIENAKGWTPMDNALSDNNTDMAHLLLYYGGKPRKKDILPLQGR
jgi:ankyrin repeat protein